MKTCASVLAVLILVCASTAGAQTKPNLNGTWKMDPQKSKFGPSGGPQAITIKFDLKEGNLAETLTIGNTGGERTLEMKYTVDGKDGVNQIGSESIKTTANWEGEALVIEWKADGRSFRRKFTLSGDGKTITMAVHQVNQGNEVDETVVLDKQ